MNEKTKKIIIITISVLVALSLLDYIIFLGKYNKAPKHNNTAIKEYISSLVNIRSTWERAFKPYWLDQFILTKGFRPVENPSKTKSIVVFGDVFAHGQFDIGTNDMLKDNESFSYYLGRYANDYKVYNRAKQYIASSAPLMLFQLENKDFYKIIDTKPKYVIYIGEDANPDTYDEKFNVNTLHKILYKKRGKHLVYDKAFIKNNIFTPYGNILGKVQDIANRIPKNKYKLKSFNDNKTNFHFLHILQSMDAIQKNWGNDVKFIFVTLYPPKYEPDETYEKNLKLIAQKGGIIVRVKDIGNKDYLDIRSGSVKEFTPLLVNYLKNLDYLK